MNIPARDNQISDDVRVDKRLVGLSFGRAARDYDAVARLQRAVADTLLPVLPRDVAPGVIVDVGAGTGYCTRRLAGLYPAASLTALDLAHGMLLRLRERAGPRLTLVCGDAENLPLRSGSVDVVFSSLAIQWCQDAAAAFGEFARVLRPGGTLAFSTFGPATLVELRESWARVDGYRHVLEFTAPAELSAGLQGAGFRVVALRSEEKVLSYPSVDALMRELKGLGARNMAAGRPRHLTGKKAMRDMMGVYESRNGSGGGQIPATFQIIYGLARRI